MSVEIRYTPMPYGDAWSVLVDGKRTPRRNEAAMSNRAHAEAWARILEQLPAGYRPKWHRVRAGSIGARAGWSIVGPDGSETHRRVEDVAELPVLAYEHAAAAPRRAVVAEAEETVRAEAARVETETSAPGVRDAVRRIVDAGRADRATEQQVEYIRVLLARRERNGDGGGVFPGPTDLDGIRRLSREDADTYIRSLRQE